MTPTLVTILLRVSGESFVADAYGSVHYHVAAAVEATGVQSARIDTLLIEASPVVRALSILSALWDRFCGHVIKLMLCTYVLSTLLCAINIVILYFTYIIRNASRNRVERTHQEIYIL